MSVIADTGTATNLENLWRTLTFINICSYYQWHDMRRYQPDSIYHLQLHSGGIQIITRKIILTISHANVIMHQLEIKLLNLYIVSRTHPFEHCTTHRHLTNDSKSFADYEWRCRCKEHFTSRTHNWEQTFERIDP